MLVVDNREQSEFNMAVSYLSRLNTLFYIADNSAMSLEINEWFHALMTLFRELSTEMNEQEIKILKHQFKLINEQMQIYNKDKMRVGVANISSKLYDDLHDAELAIRQVLKTSGLQMKMKQDARFAIED